MQGTRCSTPTQADGPAVVPDSSAVAQKPAKIPTLFESPKQPSTELIGGKSDQHWKLANGLMRYRNQLWTPVCSRPTLVSSIDLQLFHRVATCGGPKPDITALLKLLATLTPVIKRSDLRSKPSPHSCSKLESPPLLRQQERLDLILYPRLESFISPLQDCVFFPMPG